MKLRDMVPNIRYIVVKGGCTLEKDDKVWLDAHENLMSSTGGGWLPPEEWKRLRNEVKFDNDHYENEVKKAKDRIKLCIDIMADHRGKDKSR